MSGTHITLEDGTEVWTPFTRLQIGKASSAKFEASLVPWDEKQRQNRIEKEKKLSTKKQKCLFNKINDLIIPSDVELIGWVKIENPEIMTDNDRLMWAQENHPTLVELILLNNEFDLLR